MFKQKQDKLHPLEIFNATSHAAASTWAAPLPSPSTYVLIIFTFIFSFTHNTRKKESFNSPPSIFPLGVPWHPVYTPDLRPTLIEKLPSPHLLLS